jgi:hypothetical protein
MVQEVETRKKRGMGSASPETRARVSRIGGNAEHSIRGLQGADEETRRKVASKGGVARGAQRSAERARGVN